MDEKVREQILAIRDTGLTNMFDVNMVQRLAFERTSHELVIFPRGAPGGIREIHPDRRGVKAHKRAPNKPRRFVTYIPINDLLLPQFRVIYGHTKGQGGHQNEVHNRGAIRER